MKSFGAKRLLRQVRSVLLRPVEVLLWSKNGWTVPAPSRVKWSILKRYGSGAVTWIETGTYLGNTTSLLARLGKSVYSLEPEPNLAKSAVSRFKAHSHVQIINKSSEEAFPELLSEIKGSVAFWLDGHYSAGITYRGANETPIRTELGQIEKWIENFTHLVVLVDDFRCFGESDVVGAEYPSRSFLVNWADRLRLSWTVEHDIFIAWR
jgi:hypothetical protein